MQRQQIFCFILIVFFFLHVDDWSETAREVKFNITVIVMNDTYQRTNSTDMFKSILYLRHAVMLAVLELAVLPLLERTTCYGRLQPGHARTEKTTAVQTDCLAAETPERMYIRVSRSRPAPRRTNILCVCVSFRLHVP